MFANIETLEQLTVSEIRNRHPEVSFPPEMDRDCLESLGIVPVEHDPMPNAADGEAIEPGVLRREGDQVFQGWQVIPAPAPDWPAVIAAQRYAAEIGGIEWAGLRIDTDRESQALITGAALSAMLDPSYVCRWKTRTGFVDLTGEQLTNLAQAVRGYVQGCFNRESELLQALQDDTFTEDQLAQGWPPHVMGE